MRFTPFALALLPALLVAPICLQAQHTMPTITEEKPGLKARATLSADSAVAIALRTAPAGATIEEAEVEMEDGRLIYSFDLSVPGKRGTLEIGVDAKTGKVVENAFEAPAEAAAEAREDSVRARSKP
jgi:hypothetical protein